MEYKNDIRDDKPIRLSSKKMFKSKNWAYIWNHVQLAKFYIVKFKKIKRMQISNGWDIEQSVYSTKYFILWSSNDIGEEEK